ncbi:thioredoxin-like domain-containing protein [uncultured Algoriphagus sp.]|uniref:TlpA family protein disulfide reductase n=1 Tax=uncultured Algoriphagus sp. TaxID=417365 RepID=UPI0030EC533B
MKKQILTCFLGLLCLVGSTLTAQVADSPPGVDLVDKPGFYGQEGPRSPAPLEESVALIYGELINPDSLSPLLVEVRPYYLDAKSDFMVQVMEPGFGVGETFDGVMNPLVRKFSSSLSLGDRPGYFSIILGGRALLEDFIVFPGDSLKVELDLRQMDVLFAGEDAAFYEAQYAIGREARRLAFEAPRQLIAKADSRILSTPGNLEKLEHFQGQFGSRLIVMSPGKESLDHLLLGLREDNPQVIAQMDVLESFSDKLDVQEFELLEAQILGGIHYSVLTTFRKFHYPDFLARFSESEQAHYKSLILDSFQDFPEGDFGEETRLVSKDYLNYALEKSMVTALFEGLSLLGVVDSLYAGEMAEKLKTAYLSNYLSQLPKQPYVLEKYLAEVSSSPWKERLESLKRSHVPGGAVEPVVLVDLKGNELTEEDLKGAPTLLYFYFSSCSHSASYFNEYLYPLYQEVKDLGVRLISVSVDEDPAFWKSRIAKYSDPSLLNVNLRGQSKKRWKEIYEIHGYPKIMFLDRDAHILSFDIRNLGTDQESLISEFMTLYKSELE